MRLLDNAKDDASLPKFERMLKGASDEGRANTADAIRTLHKSGGRHLAPDSLRKAGSLFDTQAKPMTKNQADANLVGWANVAANVGIGDVVVDPLDAIKAAHLKGAQRRMF